jgi:hypothetical protein
MLTKITDVWFPENIPCKSAPLGKHNDAHENAVENCVFEAIPHDTSVSSSSVCSNTQ